MRLTLGVIAALLAISTAAAQQYDANQPVPLTRPLPSGEAPSAKTLHSGAGAHWDYPLPEWGKPVCKFPVPHTCSPEELEKLTKKEPRR